MKAFLKRLIFCHLLRQHDDTCAAEEGIPPTREQIDGGIDGYWDYCTMWCRRCGRRHDIRKTIR